MGNQRSCIIFIGKMRKFILRTNFHFAKYIPVSRTVFAFEERVESIRAPVFAGLLVYVLTFHLVLLKEN